MTRFLVTGATGALGRVVVDRLLQRGDDVVATVHRTPLTVDGVRETPVDLRHAEELRRVLDDADPDVIVHTAYAYRDWTLNAVTPVRLAQWAAEHGSHLTHISSDAVFSGKKAAYAENDVPEPLIPYAASKAAAEVGVAAVLPAATIVRTTLIMGHPQAPMEVLARRLALGEQDGALFTDDIRCPVHVDDLADAVLELTDARRGGIFHAGGPDALSRMEIGELVCAREGLPTDRLRPALRADLPNPGALDLRLDSSGTQRILRTRLRGAREFLA